MKLYLFYHKSSNNLYAYTTYKKFAEEFIKIRNKKCFFYKIEKIDEYDLMLFVNKYHRYQLQEIVLNDKKDSFKFIVTQNESDMLSNEIDKLISRIKWLKYYFTRNVKFNKKYNLLINNILIYNNDLENNLNTLKLFYMIVSDTF